jgi:hypothetical protein
MMVAWQYARRPRTNICLSLKKLRKRYGKYYLPGSDESQTSEPLDTIDRVLNRKLGVASVVSSDAHR